MRLLILFLVSGGLVIFAIQNREPVALILFGSTGSLTLPIAAWILLFLAAGVLTSLLVQFLIYLGRSSSRKHYPQKPEPYSPPPQEKELEPEPVARQAKATPSTTKTFSDWDTSTKQDDWSIEEPPPQTTVLQNFERRIVEDRQPIQEKPQEPKTTSQSGSVYSYGYREPENQEENQTGRLRKQDADTEKEPTEKVYDANYRMITPPYRQDTNEPPEEDEEWI